MQENINCVAIYSRKSKYTGKGESIGNQIELCKEYIRMHYGEKAAEQAMVFEDEGFSGGNLNRPDFKRMMQAANKHQFQMIIVYRLDRVSRNISDFSSLIEKLNHLGIAFISIRDKFDTSTPTGRAMMYMTSVFSQLERETIAERIRDNMHELAKTGRWLGGVTPTGYKSESIETITADGKTKKVCHLKLLPQEADVVRKIYDLFIETDSLTAVEAALLQQHIMTKTGRKFTRFSIKNILQNPAYLIADKSAYYYFSERQAELFSSIEDFDGVHGILAYNRTSQQKGRAAIHLPVSQWIVCVGKHTGIVPAKTWIKVQESLERNKSKSYRKARSNQALLTGLLFCSCGSKMYPKLSKQKGADGKPIFYYMCKCKEQSKRSACNQRNINGNMLDNAVIEEVKKLPEDKKYFLAQLEQSKHLYTDDTIQLSKLYEENKRKISILVDSLAGLNNCAAKKHIIDRIEQLGRSNEEISARVKELENTVEFHMLPMSAEQKRDVLRTVVDKIVWDGTYAHIILFGSGENSIFNTAGNISC